MSDKEDIKPIEEINGEKPPEGPVKADSEKPPATAPPPPPSGSQKKTDDTKSKTLAPQSSKAPSPPEQVRDPGKKAVIQRSKGEGGWIKYAIGAVVVLLVGAGVFYYFFYQVTFEIRPTPTPDKILLDNNEVQPGNYRMRPGVHTLDIEKEGYVSYIAAKKYSLGQHIVLDFTFQKEKSPIISLKGAKLPSLSSDQKYLFFLDNASHIGLINLSSQNANETILSNSQFPTTKILKVSADKSFAMLLDDEAIKIVNFNKADLINQSVIKLPPLASAIHSLTWNDSASEFFPEANSKILYDLLTTLDWDVYQANLSHTQAEIIMQINRKNFPNFNMDWSNNPNKVLITGGEIGILDLSQRTYSKVSSDKTFTWGKWSSSGQEAVATDSEGGVWLYKSGNLTKMPFNTSAKLVDFVDFSTLAAVSSGRPIKYNFDTQQKMNYAEVKGLAKSTDFLVKDDLFYFSSADGVFSGKFEAQGYQENSK